MPLLPKSASPITAINTNAVAGWLSNGPMTASGEAPKTLQLPTKATTWPQREGSNEAPPSLRSTEERYLSDEDGASSADGSTCGSVDESQSNPHRHRHRRRRVNDVSRDEIEAAVIESVSKILRFHKPTQRPKMINLTRVLPPSLRIGYHPATGKQMTRANRPSSCILVDRRSSPVLLSEQFSPRHSSYEPGTPTTPRMLGPLLSLSSPSSSAAAPTSAPAPPMSSTTPATTTKTTVLVISRPPSRLVRKSSVPSPRTPRSLHASYASNASISSFGPSPRAPLTSKITPPSKSSHAWPLPSPSPTSSSSSTSVSPTQSPLSTSPPPTRSISTTAAAKTSTTSNYHAPSQSSFSFSSSSTSASTPSSFSSSSSYPHPSPPRSYSIHKNPSRFVAVPSIPRSHPSSARTPAPPLRPMAVATKGQPTSVTPLPGMAAPVTGGEGIGRPFRRFGHGRPRRPTTATSTTPAATKQTQMQVQGQVQVQYYRGVPSSSSSSSSASRHHPHSHNIPARDVSVHTGGYI